MNPIQQDNKLETKNDQHQTPAIKQEVVEQATNEVAPDIKSEENKANWKAFREQRELERKAREEADRRALEKAAEAEALRAALEAITNKPSTSRQSSHDYDDNEETEEQRIDKRVEAAIKQREAQAEQQRKQREMQEYPERLVSNYSDFNKVCNSENLDYLEYHYPEVATPFKHLPDGYDKWAAIYKAVKRFVPNIDSKQDQHRAEKNLNKPGSISSPGNTQGGNAMPAARLDEERKKANWERMQRTLKGLS